MLVRLGPELACGQVIVARHPRHRDRRDDRVVHVPAPTYRSHTRHPPLAAAMPLL